MLEIKELIEDLGRTFETFKVENDLRIKEIEAKGHADPLLAEKVEKINAEVGKSAEMKRQLEALDKVAGRGGSGPNFQRFQIQTVVFSFPMQFLRP
jgi:hypothetical protein